MTPIIFHVSILNHGVSFVDDPLLLVDDQSQPRPPAEVESASQSASTVFTQLSLDVSIEQVSRTRHEILIQVQVHGE